LRFQVQNLYFYLKKTSESSFGFCIGNQLHTNQVRAQVTLIHDQTGMDCFLSTRASDLVVHFIILVDNTRKGALCDIAKTG